MEENGCDETPGLLKVVSERQGFAQTKEHIAINDAEVEAEQPAAGESAASAKTKRPHEAERINDATEAENGVSARRRRGHQTSERFIRSGEREIDVGAALMAARRCSAYEDSAGRAKFWAWVRAFSEDVKSPSQCGVPRK